MIKLAFSEKLNYLFTFILMMIILFTQKNNDNKNQFYQSGIA